MPSLKFTAMVCSKVLHDMAGPIGAVMNGVELLAEKDSSLPPEEIHKLLQSSADQLNAQLQVYRIAFGALTGVDHDLDTSMVSTTLDHYAGYRGFQVNWKSRSDTLNKDLARLILSGAFVLGESVRKRGQLTISLGPTALADFLITASAERINLSQDGLQGLRGEEGGELSTAKICGLYAHTIAKEIGCKLAIEQTPSSITLKGKF